jgi:hypothetical protein
MIVTDIKWRNISKPDFIITLQTLMEVYAVAKWYDTDSDCKIYYEDTRKGLYTSERIFLYRKYKWIDGDHEFFVNEAMVGI